MAADQGLNRYERATSDLDPPFALVDLEAFDANAAALIRSARGKPIRLASKSVRARALQTRALDRPGFAGTLAFTLPEALWLAEKGFEDLLVAYPTAHRGSLQQLTTSDADVILMVDGGGWQAGAHVVSYLLAVGFLVSNRAVSARG